MVHRRMFAQKSTDRVNRSILGSKELHLCCASITDTTKGLLACMISPTKAVLPS